MKRVWIVGAIAALGALVLVFYDEISKCLGQNALMGFNQLARNNCRHYEGDYDLYNQEQALPFRLRVTWDDGARLRITNGQLVVDLSATFLEHLLWVKGTDGVWREFRLLRKYNKESTQLELIGFGIEGTDLYARRTSFVR